MHILIVDDDKDDQLLISEAISSFSKSITFESAYDGEEALEKLERNTATPDLILLDINMPKMDGITCLKKLNEIPKLEHVPVIVLSTTINDSMQSKVNLLGAGYLQKPDTYGALERMLHENLRLISENVVRR